MAEPEKIYTQADLDRISKTSYDCGYMDGYSDGSEAGYDEGKTDWENL